MDNDQTHATRRITTGCSVGMKTKFDLNTLGPDVNSTLGVSSFTQEIISHFPSDVNPRSVVGAVDVPRNSNQRDALLAHKSGT